MGQGQGQRAEKLILDAHRNGHWIVLQNCHLATMWLNEMERICNDNVLRETAHTNYRLWCTTSYTCEAFPVSVLQDSVKLTLDSNSNNFKTKLMKPFYMEPLTRERFFSQAFSFSETIQRYWLRSVFALVWFHALIQERTEYGPLGWNVPYQFHDSDLK